MACVSLNEYKEFIVHEYIMGREPEEIAKMIGSKPDTVALNLMAWGYEVSVKKKTRTYAPNPRKSTDKFIIDGVVYKDVTSDFIDIGAERDE